MKPIKLLRGDVTLVSEEDFETVTQHNWRKTSDGYVVANIDKKPIFLHRFILDSPPWNSSRPHKWK